MPFISAKGISSVSTLGGIGYSPQKPPDVFIATGGSVAYDGD